MLEQSWHTHLPNPDTLSVPPELQTWPCPLHLPSELEQPPSHLQSHPVPAALGVQLAQLASQLSPPGALHVMVAVAPTAAAAGGAGGAGPLWVGRSPSRLASPLRAPVRSGRKVVRWPYFIIARGPIYVQTTVRKDGNPALYQAYWAVLTCEPDTSAGGMNYTQPLLDLEAIPYGTQIAGDGTAGPKIDTALRGPATAYNALTAPDAPDLFSVLGDLKYFWYQDPDDLSVRPAWSWSAAMAPVNALNRLMPGTPNAQPSGDYDGTDVRVTTAVPALTVTGGSFVLAAATAANTPGLPPVSATYYGANKWTVDGSTVTFPEITDASGGGKTVSDASGGGKTGGDASGGGETVSGASGDGS